MEPYEEAVVEVPEQYVGSVVELFAQRKGEMQDMQPSIEVSCWLGQRNVVCAQRKGDVRHMQEEALQVHAASLCIDRQQQQQQQLQ
jgi:translation elongation factor EF-G